MEDLKCPFRRVLLPGDFGCRHARAVTRREGPDIACQAPQTQPLCEAVLAALKGVGLPALGYTDDLTELPHGVAMKVQMGGLLGLQKLAGATAVGDSTAVDDVGALVETAVGHYGGAASIPCAQAVSEMSAFQLRRRRGR